MSRSLKPDLDTISLRGVYTTAVIGSDAWNRSGKAQPLVISLHLSIDTTSAGLFDEVAQTFSYGQMSKDIVAKIANGNFLSIDHVTSEIISLADGWPGEMLRIVVKAPKALLRVEGGFGREVMLRKKDNEIKSPVWHVDSNEWFVRNLKIPCIIGVNKHERLEKQIVGISLRINGERDKIEYSSHIREGHELWRRLVRQVCELVEPSSFQTLEALAAVIARTCLTDFPFPEITVSLEKPSAFTFVEGAGVEITRSRTSVQKG